jgi:RNA polymerase sigma-70 factor, ECF subfamily
VRELKSDISNEELFQHIKENNSNALKELFFRFNKNLCYFVFSYVKDSLASEDIVSDIFIDFWEKRDRIVITGKVKMYLYTAARNKALNYKRDNSIQFENLDAADRLTLKMNDNPENKLNYEELKKILDGLVDTLPEKRRLIFQMRRFDGMTHDEIAEILNISKNTVKNQMVKAIEFLNTQYPRLKKIFPLG